MRDMITGRVNGRNGNGNGRSWTLTVHREVPEYGDIGGYGDYMPFARTWYQLDGLLVTPHEAEAICSRRLGAPVHASVSYDYGRSSRLWPCVRLDGVEVTPEEADLISRGVPPLTALLPVLVFRSLTLDELERA